MRNCPKFDYNKDLWSIDRIDKDFNISDKKNDISYFIRGNIIAIKQVSDYDFLVFEKASDHMIFEYLELEYGVVFHLYQRDFKSCDFINDDLILFDKDSFSSITFSISNHIECIQNISYIVTRPAVVDAESISFCSSYHTELIFYDTKYPKYLFVTYKLLSFRKNEYIQVLVDAETWKPISPAFSTSRNGFVEISENKKLLQIFREDNYKLEEINKREFYEKPFPSNENLLKTANDFINIINNN